MMKSTKIILALGLLLCLIAVPVAAEDAPVLPASYYGTATYSNGDSLPSGSIIFATVDGITSSYTLTEAGKIGEAGTFGTKFLVSGTTSGSSITFSCGNIAAEQTGSFTSGSLNEINLVFATTTAKVQLSASSDAATQFKEQPTIVAKEGATIPSNVKVCVVVGTTASLPANPESFTQFKVYDITVENAESLNGEFSVIVPITLSDTELKNSFSNNPDSVRVFHSTGTEWEKVPIIKTETKSGSTLFYVQMSAFSPYMLGKDTTEPVKPSDDSSGSSGGKTSSGTQYNPTPTGTQTPTSTGTPIPTNTDSVLTPSASGGNTQPTQSSPAPAAGIIAGLSAAALVLSRLRR